MAVKLRFEKVPNINQLHFFSKKRVEERFNFEWHFHPEFELTLILKGQGTRIVGDNISNFDRGDLVLVGSNLPHTWFSTASNPAFHFKTGSAQETEKDSYTEAIIIQFNLETITTLLPASLETNHVSNLLNRASMGLLFKGSTATQVAERMCRLDSAQGIPRIIEFLTILDLLGNSKNSECCTLSSQLFAGQAETFDYNRINRVCNYLNQHFAGPVSEDEAARVANLSVWSFSRFFHVTTGKTFKAYLTDLRVGLACRLLIETELPVSQIALEAGFNNLSNFNRQFQKLKQLSPRTYRQHFTTKSAPLEN